MSTLQDELETAFLKEAQSYIQCVYFARKADSEGYKQISKLFRTAAEIELIQAGNLMRALGLLKTTIENIHSLLNIKPEKCPVCGSRKETFKKVD